MAKATYFELLKHPEWQKMRLVVMERERFECEQCGDKSKTLNVHHTYYEKGLKPWEYPAETLRCLCEDCHKLAEQLRLELLRAIGRMSIEDMHTTLGFMNCLNLEQSEVPVQLDNHEQLVGGLRALFPLCRWSVGEACRIAARQEGAIFQASDFTRAFSLACRSWLGNGAPREAQPITEDCSA